MRESRAMHSPLSMVPHEFLVLWQSPEEPGYRCVGTLWRESDEYVFAYSIDGRANEAFRGFANFPDKSVQYRSPVLFPLFASRVMTSRRDGYQEYLVALGLHTVTPDPFVVLERTLGVSATDQILVLPVPEVTEEGRLSFRFLVHGARHVDPLGERLARVSPGSALRLVQERGNPSSARAVLVGDSLPLTRESALGYVPEVLCGLVTTLLDTDSVVQVWAEHVNHVGSVDVPAQLRLLVRVEAVVPTHFDVRDALQLPGTLSAV